MRCLAWLITNGRRGISHSYQVLQYRGLHPIPLIHWAPYPVDVPWNVDFPRPLNDNRPHFRGA